MKLTIFAVMLALAGCATTKDAQVSYVQSCAAYGAALNLAVEARQAGRLSKEQIAQISLIDQQVTPICTGPLPADPTAATQQVTTAVTTLTVMEAVKGATK